MVEAVLGGIREEVRLLDAGTCSGYYPWREEDGHGAYDSDGGD